MSIRTETRHAAAVASALLLSIAALAIPIPGQTAEKPPRSEDALAWLGCWDVLPDPESDSPTSPRESQVICVEQGGAPDALQMTVLIDERVVSEETIVPDGRRRPVSDGGCDGWIRTIPSADGQRLYLDSEATCSGGKPKHLTGASLIVSGDRWIDIHALWEDGEREVRIQRYRPVGADIPRLPGAFPTAARTARRAAAERLSVDDVIEALRIVDTAVVEAMLLESDARFGIDSGLLLRLEESEVPGEVIDLMVALSFPEYFSVEGETVTRQPEVYYGGYWSPWYPYYGYGHYYHHRYAHHDENRGGKVVSGRGYVSVTQTGQPSGALSGLLRGDPSGGGAGMGAGNSGGGSGGGSVSSSGFTSGDAGSARPAVPK